MSDALTGSCAPTPAPSSELDEALSALFTLGVGALRARRCSLYLRDDGGQILTLCQARGLDGRPEAAQVPVDGTIVGLVLRSRASLLVQDVLTYPALPAHQERYGTPSFLSVPVLVENDAVGVLNAADRQDGQPFSEDDLQSAEMVSRSIAAVLHSDLLARRAAGEGEVDPVTGLYSARHFEKRLAQEVERAHRAHLPLTLVLVDVTSYGDVAARVGVQTAGVLMRCVGEMIAQAVRQSDVLAQRASDQIAVLLPSTPLDRARRVARTIAREIAHEKLPAQLRYDLEALHISIGLAALAPSADGVDLVKRATEACAQARERGDAVVAAAGDELTEVGRRPAPRAAHQHTIASALRLGIPYLADPADAATLSAVRLLSVEMARTYVCFPVAFESGTLTLAMADPTDAGAIQAVSQFTRMAVYPVASAREKILQAIATLMGERKGQPGDKIRVQIPPVGSADAFVRAVRRLTDTFSTLRVAEITVEGAVSARAPSSAERDALLARLAAVPDLTLHPDRQDLALFHLKITD